MKKCLIITGMLYVAFSVWADDYKILQMNTTFVKIGNRECKTGSTFSDKSVIHWSKPKQAFKAQHLKTKKIRLFSESEFRAVGCESVAEYFIKNNRTSSRAFAFTELTEELSKTFYLLDTILIDPGAIKVDDNQYFYISYTYKGIVVRKPLKKQNDELLVERSLFPMELELDDIIVSVAFHQEGVEEDYAITEKMHIVFIPLIIQ